MKPPVFVTRPLPPAATEIVEKSCEAEMNPRDVRLTPRELRTRLRGKVGLLCMLTDAVNAVLLRAAPDLRVVSNVAVGYNNIDVAAATARRVMVTNTPGVLTETTADLTWALLLATARRLVEADRFLRAGKWKEWSLMFFVGTDVHGKTLGVCGLGRIGQAVARRAQGFGMRILYTQRRRLPESVERELQALYVDKETLLCEADYVTLHLPLAPETTHYIGAHDLTLMKRTAFLINTSRGPIVDEKALVTALRGRTIAGAGLDVFEREPRVEKDLLTMKNVVLLPHIASASVETRTRMACMAAENLVAAVTGSRPPHLVNPEVWEMVHGGTR